MLTLHDGKRVPSLLKSCSEKSIRRKNTAHLNGLIYIYTTGVGNMLADVLLCNTTEWLHSKVSKVIFHLKR